MKKIYGLNLKSHLTKVNLCMISDGMVIGRAVFYGIIRRPSNLEAIQDKFMNVSRYIPITFLDLQGLDYSIIRANKPKQKQQ